MRARILFVPIFASFEARAFRAAAGDWADVESFDTPGTGARRDEPIGDIESVARAGTARLDELGWPACVLIADSHAQAAAIELALSDERVAGVCISHAASRYTTRGERAALSPAVHAAAAQLLESDLRSFGHALTQLTQGRIDEEWVEAFIEQVPRGAAHARTSQLDSRELATRLRQYDGEILLGMHSGCLMWTQEGFEDAAATLPEATTISCDEVPLSHPRFQAAVRALCERALG